MLSDIFLQPLLYCCCSLFVLFWGLCSRVHQRFDIFARHQLVPKLLACGGPHSVQSASACPRSLDTAQFLLCRRWIPVTRVGTFEQKTHGMELEEKWEGWCAVRPQWDIKAFLALYLLWTLPTKSLMCHWLGGPFVARHVFLSWHLTSINNLVYKWRRKQDLPLNSKSALNSLTDTSLSSPRRSGGLSSFTVWILCTHRQVFQDLSVKEA